MRHQHSPSGGCNRIIGFADSGFCDLQTPTQRKSVRDMAKPIIGDGDAADRGVLCALQNDLFAVIHGILSFAHLANKRPKGEFDPLRQIALFRNEEAIFAIGACELFRSAKIS